MLQDSESRNLYDTTMTLQESNKPQDPDNFRFQKLFWFLQTGFWSHFDPNPHSFRILCPRTSQELSPDNRTISQLPIFAKLEQQTWPSQDTNLDPKTAIENLCFPDNFSKNPATIWILQPTNIFNGFWWLLLNNTMGWLVFIKHITFEHMLFSTIC